MSLVICAGCTRHIKQSECRCPFCGAGVSEDVAHAARAIPKARLGRAALAAFAAATVGSGCGGKAVEQPTGTGGAPGNGGAANTGGAHAGAGGKPLGTGGFKGTGGTLGTGGLLNTGGYVAMPPYGVPPYWTGGAPSASGGSPATPMDASAPDSAAGADASSPPRLDCIDDFGGGVPARCCPSPAPDCKGKPDGYPGYICVPPPHSFCSCGCQMQQWVCAC
jgi:hypothetical protein